MVLLWWGPIVSALLITIFFLLVVVLREFASRTPHRPARTRHGRHTITHTHTRTLRRFRVFYGVKKASEVSLLV